MNINGWSNKFAVSGQVNGQKEKAAKNTLFSNLYQGNLSMQQRDSFDKSAVCVGDTYWSNYEYYSIKTINRIKESGQIDMSAVVEAEVRNISYGESHHIQINMEEGYTYRAQVEVSNHSVYIEYRDDAGMTKAYVADVPSIAKDTENPVEQMALASWNKVLEENRRQLGFTEFKQPILSGMNVPGKYVNGCFISEMTTYEDTIYFGKFGDACGMADIFGGSWSDYYSIDNSSGDSVTGDATAYNLYSEVPSHPESIEVKLFTGRTIIIDVNRISQMSQLKGVLSKAEYAQLEEAVEKEAGSIRMSEEKWEKLLQWTDKAIEEFKERTRAMIEQQEKEAEMERQMWKNVPYGYLANEDGVIVYNGVTFTCDEEKNAICLGDMSNPQDVLTIPLAEGGCLKVNRDNYGDLARAITMFSPEDRNRIMRAIQQDKMAQKMKQEIEDEKGSIGLKKQRTEEVTQS